MTSPPNRHDWSRRSFLASLGAIPAVPGVALAWRGKEPGEDVDKLAEALRVELRRV